MDAFCISLNISGPTLLGMLSIGSVSYVAVAKDIVTIMQCVER